jgi:hypothetical protein
VLW